MHEKHKQGGHHLKNMVYSANDGIVTTFAVVAGVVGAALNPTTILILGFANLLADGFSMATGNYLGSKSENQLYTKEKEREEREMEEVPEKEGIEILNILKEKGYQGTELEQLTDLIMKNKKFSVDFMMQEELKLSNANVTPFKNAWVTFVSFVVAGLIPILPFIFIPASANRFLLAIFFTAMALFVVGASRSVFTDKYWFLSGLEMLFVGGVAATIAYLIGFVISQIV